MFIINVALFLPIGILSYVADRMLLPGVRVIVGVRNKKHLGFVVETIVQQESNKKLKTIDEVIDIEPFLTTLDLQLLLWASKYYHAYIGQVLPMLLPKKIRSLKGINTYLTDFKVETKQNYSTTLEQVELTKEQEQIVIKILTNKDKFHTYLLAGVTGSGKTEIYHALIEAMVRNNQQTILIVPEISLTPQMLQRLQARHTAGIFTYHSRMTDKQKFNSWVAARNGIALIIIATRSGGWLPLKNPGLFIIDEEHDGSLKQQTGVRYSVRDLLIRRAQLVNCPIVLGSATPSLETLHNALSNKYCHLTLPTRFCGSIPQFCVINIGGQKLFEGLSDVVISKLKLNFTAKQQSMVFLNRRGFAPRLKCLSCGWSLDCNHCSAFLVIHYEPTLRAYCHHCNDIKAIPNNCKNCHNQNLTLQGEGTERIAAVLQKQLPSANIVRVDGDTIVNQKSLEKFINDMSANKIDILVGTQILAKGHHFPKLSLVVILDIDYGFYSYDFRGSERMGQLLMQVAGRAGRVSSGEVLIQTKFPHNPILQELLKCNFFNFSKILLQEREQAKLPPFNYQILLRASSKQMDRGLMFLNEIKKWCKQFSQVESHGPVPSLVEKKRDFFCYQLLLQAEQRKKLHDVCFTIHKDADRLAKKLKIHWSIDVDPLDMY